MELHRILIDGLNLQHADSLHKKHCDSCWMLVYFLPHFKFTETSLDLLKKQILFENSTRLRCNKYKHLNIKVRKMNFSVLSNWFSSVQSFFICPNKMDLSGWQL